MARGEPILPFGAHADFARVFVRAIPTAFVIRGNGGFGTGGFVGGAAAETGDLVVEFVVVPIEFAVVVEAEPPVEVAVYVPVAIGIEAVGEALGGFGLGQSPYAARGADFTLAAGVVYVAVADEVYAAAEAPAVAFAQGFEVLPSELLQLGREIGGLAEVFELLPRIFVGTVFKQALRQRKAHGRDVGVGCQHGAVEADGALVVALGAGNQRLRQSHQQRIVRPGQFEINRQQ